jgi:L-lysine exporter family protein LysE/ArgO
MPVTAVAASTLLGFGANLGLLWSLGAQNTFVIRQGLTRRHVGLVAAICIASDIALIGSGITGMAQVVASHQWLSTVLAIGGAGFLYGYAALAARRALRPSPGMVGTQMGLRAGAGRTALAIAATTWLNPHVLLETVVVLGTAATTHGPAGQWWFGIGAITASTIWFLALGYGVRVLQPAFTRPITWQILEGLTAVMMIVLATTVLHTAFR